MVVNKAEKYKDFFNKDWLNGPCEIRILDELTMKFPPKPNSRTLVMNCHMGLSVLFLAKEMGVQAVAVDEKASPTLNSKLFDRWGIGRNAMPLRCSAQELPFAEGYFDSLVWTDGFEKMAESRDFSANKLLSVLAPGGTGLFAVPGVREDYSRLPEELEQWKELLGRDFELLHSPQWWQKYFSGCDGVDDVRAFSLENFGIAWKEWLSCGAPEAQAQRERFSGKAENYLCHIGIFVKKHSKR